MCGQEPRSQQVDESKLTADESITLEKIRCAGWVAFDVNETVFTKAGDQISRRTVQKLIDDGHLEPQNDGLFEEFSQTYVVAK